MSAPGQVNYYYGAPPPPPAPAASPQAPVMVIQNDSRPATSCRDDKNPIGVCGCDKRVNPNCCLRFCCPWCTALNYEGCTLIVILLFIPITSGLIGCYVCCCWQAPIWGIHYNKQNILVGAPMGAVQPGAGQVTYVAAGSGKEPFPEFMSDDDDV
ncbi:unnamed protein product [Amoebophrya sp. A120]|nr:unnamed protein product [Amoebophrya sp. A120]|eukprot:GSA120T00010473001.1